MCMAPFTEVLYLSTILSNCTWEFYFTTCIWQLLITLQMKIFKTYDEHMKCYTVNETTQQYIKWVKLALPQPATTLKCSFHVTATIMITALSCRNVYLIPDQHWLICVGDGSFIFMDEGVHKLFFFFRCITTTLWTGGGPSQICM